MRKIVAKYPLYSFFCVAFVWSWLCWLPVTMGSSPAARIQLSMAWGALLVLLGAFGPSVSGVLVTGIIDEKKGIGQLLGRILVWRVSLVWYVTVLFLTALIIAFAIAISAAAGSTTPSFANASKWFLLPVILVQVVILGGPLQEEIGWRGFALPKLQAQTTALGASVIIGLLWGIWHLPLFPIPWSSQHGIPVLLFIAHDLALAVLFTWVYNNTKGSLLLMLLFHGAFNTWTWFFPITPKAAGGITPLWIAVGMLWIAAAIVVVVFGPRTLRKEMPAS